MIKPTSTCSYLKIYREKIVERQKDADNTLIVFPIVIVTYTDLKHSLVPVRTNFFFPCDSYYLVQSLLVALVVVTAVAIVVDGSIVLT